MSMWARVFFFYFFCGHVLSLRICAICQHVGACGLALVLNLTL